MEWNKYFLIGMTMALQISTAMLARGQGNALDFDGGSDFVQVPNNTAFEFADGTIEAWVKPG
jgi:hypothetical protein